MKILYENTQKLVNDTVMMAAIPVSLNVKYVHLTMISLKLCIEFVKYF